MQLDILIVFLFSTFALTLSPGPDIIYVFYRSISNGKFSGIRTVFGLTTGLFCHTLLMIFGVSIFIKNNDSLFFIIKLFGCIYFVFLAFKTLFFVKKNEKFLNKKNDNDFLIGLMMNLLNPKVSLFFIAFFPGFIFHDNLSYEIQFLILGLLFWLIATLTFLLIVLISSRFKSQFQNLIGSNFIKYLQVLIFLFISFWIINS